MVWPELQDSSAGVGGSSTELPGVCPESPLRETSSEVCGYVQGPGPGWMGERKGGKLGFSESTSISFHYLRWGKAILGSSQLPLLLPGLSFCLFISLFPTGGQKTVKEVTIAGYLPNVRHGASVFRTLARLILTSALWGSCEYHRFRDQGPDALRRADLLKGPRLGQGGQAAGGARTWMKAVWLGGSCLFSYPSYLFVLSMSHVLTFW